MDPWVEAHVTSWHSRLRTLRQIQNADEFPQGVFDCWNVPDVVLPLSVHRVVHAGRQYGVVKDARSEGVAVLCGLSGGGGGEDASLTQTLLECWAQGGARVTVEHEFDDGGEADNDMVDVLVRVRFHVSTPKLCAAVRRQCAGQHQHVALPVLKWLRRRRLLPAAAVPAAVPAVPAAAPWMSLFSTPLLRHQLDFVAWAQWREGPGACTRYVSALALNERALLWERVVGADECSRRLERDCIMQSLEGHRLYVAHAGSRHSTVCVEAVGGVLCDDPGLGKTLSVLGLVAATLPASRAVHGGGAAAESMIEEVDGEPLLRSSATCVVCPLHLVDHWRREVTKHCRRRGGGEAADGKRRPEEDGSVEQGEQQLLVVVTLRTHAELDAATYADVLRADLVIVSETLLSTGSDRGFAWERAGGQAAAFLRSTRPAVRCIEWYRVVYDTPTCVATARMNRAQGAKLVMKSADAAPIPARRRWVLSSAGAGAPLPPPGSAAAIMAALKPGVFATARLLHAREDDAALVPMQDNERIHMSMLTFVAASMRRATRAQLCAAGAAMLPAVRPVEVPVALTALESAAYRARLHWRDAALLRLLCCSPELLRLGLPPGTARPVSAWRFIQGGSSEYLRSVVAALDDATCAVCTERPAAPVVTRCGHVFCMDCISTWLSTKRDCPSCRAQPISVGRDVFSVDAGACAKPQDAEAVCQELRSVHGSKAATLLRIMRDRRAADAGAKFVVFSEHHDELGRMGDVLTQEGVKCEWYAGSTKLATLRRLSVGKTTVLLASPQQAAGGVDLEATDVVFLGPSEANAAALARLVRLGCGGRVLRAWTLVTLDTVEEEHKSRVQALEQLRARLASDDDDSDAD